MGFSGTKLLHHAHLNFTPFSISIISIVCTSNSSLELTFHTVYQMKDKNSLKQVEGYNTMQAGIARISNQKYRIPVKFEFQIKSKRLFLEYVCPLQHSEHIILKIFVSYLKFKANWLL